ncbi:2TM domain-containing protein [Flavimarina sp. Hel_I_48]|uniref:2TM domain-containing protein n=1 Tax=Flavimarina sp. Hel_I_48 TaxID=1392488 RepID=UPI0004DFACBD|nr:2TM domain-containing protein [Flavimarina sp. Hel_I_48]
MKTISRFFRISLLITGIVILINLVFTDTEMSDFFDMQQLGIFFFYSFTLSVVNSTFFRYFNQKIGWQKAIVKRIVLATTGSIVITMVTYFICRAVHLILFVDKYTLSEFLENEKISYYFFPLIFTIAVMLVFYLIYFYKALQEQKVKEQKIIAGTANAQFDALKNQLDPHFLFNSLNVLASLIEENPEKAQKFTGSLSKVYRYVLEQKNKDLVTVGEELRFAKLYMELLKMRFEDAIIFEFSEELLQSEAKVVPLSLQLLLENTVKHNKVTPSSPLKISIRKYQNMLVVKNKLQPKEILKNKTGVGLANIKSRYNLLTRREVEILKTDDAFIVSLPLLTKQTKPMAMTETTFDDSNSYSRAKKQVEKEKAFYGNLTSYCIIIPMLAVFNYLSTSFPWVIFPAMGWGIGILFHGFAAFNYHPFFGREWEARKIKQIMHKKD